MASDATALNPRQRRLWAALCDRKKVTTGDIRTLNRSLGAPKGTTARADAKRLCGAGLLVEHGPANGRWYEPKAVAS